MIHINIANLNVRQTDISEQILCPITAGMCGATIKLSFDDSWRTLIPTVVFRSGGIKRDSILLDDGIVQVPYACLEQRDEMLHVWGHRSG